MDEKMENPKWVSQAEQRRRDEAVAQEPEEVTEVGIGEFVRNVAQPPAPDGDVVERIREIITSARTLRQMAEDSLAVAREGMVPQSDAVCSECKAPCTDRDLVGNQTELGFPKYWCGRCINQHLTEDRVKELERQLASMVSAQGILRISDEQIKQMVNRFLGWRLPENFNPDGGISFKKIRNELTAYPAKNEPTGTNLFDAVQAEEMARYMVEGMMVSSEADDRTYSGRTLRCNHCGNVVSATTQVDFIRNIIADKVQEIDKLKQQLASMVTLDAVEKALKDEWDVRYPTGVIEIKAMIAAVRARLTAELRAELETKCQPKQ